ncbi:glycine dehydrogenase (aminomethyl-transferring) [Brumimicrobium salinarum]|uniref:Glycine dehydrogenase (decarboxylating) n=1 Tax=Brumimicrobium salinarum TaxID=2058658 RepID=A0A2I0R669_9FLAO|nr:aminomethyl-transferring glycine dehydrogenase [Brumimicrobium salinarum]PKR81860.1 glycine dehydrogenase (aminomethyl-transferring) [Brumimicrobium salinarum]
MHAFSKRHIGPSQDEKKAMLAEIGVDSIDELMELTVPKDIRLKNELNIDTALTEKQYLDHIGDLAVKNKVFKSYIGLGYSETNVPPVIQRNILENPGWYTAYTPYQAEIAQGRLEALLNFQTMIMDLTGLEIANASLLDESTAAAEAMIMFFNARARKDVKAGKNKFFVSEFTYPQTIDVIKGRAKHLGIELVFGDPTNYDLTDDTIFGALVQYPDVYGRVKDLRGFVDKATKQNVKVAVAADIMSLVLLEAPGKMGVDVVCGSTQRFGVPMGYGGPHAAYFATRESYKRHIPGRIIGVSKDADGNVAYRMALQTREQHIKRDRATSNICTAQALLAVMAGMYAVYHGPEGLKYIAQNIHNQTATIHQSIEKAGYKVLHDDYFDTLWIETPEGLTCQQLKTVAEEHHINLRYINENQFSISVGERTNDAEVEGLVSVLGLAAKETKIDVEFISAKVNQDLARKNPILTHEVFNSYHSETKMMRYMKWLENKDLSLVHSMIALGSCTMKLNAAAQLMPITWPEFSNLHPFAPVNQATGYHEMIKGLEKDLCEITGFHAMSMQPNSGAQGEYAGLMAIKAYHESNGDSQRNICLIPSSAHGTNPASAVMAGFKVVVTKCDEAGNIDIEDLRKNAEKHSDKLGAIMVTYPSTHGVFEAGIKEITQIIHDHGGQVYMDGANMNAQVGLTNPGNIGADVCHLNLHKTFAIPHGGGGPGMGPIGVAKHLAPFIPGSPLVEGVGGEKAIHAISGAPYGSALILLISYAYIKMLGTKGLKHSTEIAIVNANYIKARLSKHYPILYSGENNTVGHEMILDCREFKRTAGIEVADIAKRLIDYGFHSPTVSFPVAGTLMIEPTESEDTGELDRFCEAMINIRKEIQYIEDGHADQDSNLLKNAPHTAECMINQDWKYDYSPKEAAYPLEYLVRNKFWAPVRRIDDAFGDRNLMCSCPAISSYDTEEEEAFA